jgi:hypothetical protein
MIDAATTKPPAFDVILVHSFSLSGTGPRYVKIGRSVRYPESSIREFVKSRMRGSTSEV